MVGMNKQEPYMINLGVEESQTESVPEEIVILEKGEVRSEEHTSELQSPVPSSYAVFCLKNKNRLK